MTDIPETPQATERFPFPSTPLNLNIHLILQTSKNLQYEQESYVKYCTARLQRIKKKAPQSSLFTCNNLTEQTSASSTEPAKITTSKFSKSRGLYCNKTLDETNIRCDEGLELLLVEAERRKARSSTIKAFNQCTDHSSIKRLKKASVYSLLLEKVCRHPGLCTDKSALEASAYHSNIVGLLALETSDYSLGKASILKARSIYDKLAEAHRGVSVEEKDIFNRLSKELEPSVRYCSYNLNLNKSTTSVSDDGEGSFGNDEDLKSRYESMLTANDPSDSSSSTTSDDLAPESEDTVLVDLDGRSIPVRSLSLQENLAELDALEQQLQASPADEPLFLSLLKAYDLCLHLIKHPNEDKLLKPYFKCRKISAMMSYTNNLLVNNADSKPLERATLYDALLQNSKTYATTLLSGNSGNSSTDISEDNSELFLLNSCSTIRYRAHRCYQLGRLREEAGVYGEGYKLYTQAIALAGQAAEEYSNALEELEEEGAAKDEVKNKIEECVQLDREICGRRCQLQGSAFLSAEGAGNSSGANVEKDLLRRLQDFVSSSSKDGKEINVFEVPRPIDACPVKPTFFDIAFNYVTFPDLGVDIQQPETAGGGRAAASGGGLFGGWFR